jgi:surface antigen
MKPMAIFVKASGRKLACLALAGALLGTAGGTAAKAQIFTPFGMGYNGPSLKQADYDAAKVAVGKLLNEKPAQVGRYESWSNPASGNHGRFTILSIYTQDNMPCRKVKADVIYGKAGSAPRSFTLGACQIPSGQWKTVT